MFLALGLLFTCLLPLSADAQTIGPERVLIRNVVLFDPNGVTEDKVVNILIRANKLDIVTEDKISRDDADMAVDANRGILLGKLAVGQEPSFLIFEDDPRNDFDVMMDTFTYSVFAVKDGIVMKNRLVGVVADDPEEEPTKAGWLAYTPPPFMVPLDYADASKWNQWEGDWVSGIFTGGLFLDRMYWASQDEVSLGQVGDLGDQEGGEIRGLRFGVVGTINFEKPWIYTIFGATNAFDKGFESEELDNVAWFDWRLDIPFFNNSVMSIGKQKEPISGERVQSMMFNHMQERSAVSDALMPSRNVGIVWSGYSPQRHTTWAFGVFNDWLDADQDFDDSASQAISRLTWVPLHTADDSSLLHLGIGYRYSDAKEGVRYRTEPEFNKSPVFVDTGFGMDDPVMPANKSETWNAELSWRRGPVWLASEYTRTDVDSPEFGNPSFDGYWVGLSWIMTGEMRAYNKKSGVFGGVPVAKSVYQNGKGAWELSARWSSIDLEDDLVHGGKMDIASAGLTWWLNPIFGINVNYRYIWNELDGEEGTSSGITSRLMLILQ
jgi:phosphate-selective porin OprO/OprP